MRLRSLHMLQGHSSLCAINPQQSYNYVYNYDSVFDGNDHFIRKDVYNPYNSFKRTRQ